jgi:hypothetical protein
VVVRRDGLSCSGSVINSLPAAGQEAHDLRPAGQSRPARRAGESPSPSVPGRTSGTSPWRPAAPRTVCSAVPTPAGPPWSCGPPPPSRPRCTRSSRRNPVQADQAEEFVDGQTEPVEHAAHELLPAKRVRPPHRMSALSSLFGPKVCRKSLRNRPAVGVTRQRGGCRAPPPPSTVSAAWKDARIGADGT